MLIKSHSFAIIKTRVKNYNLIIISYVISTPAIFRNSFSIVTKLAISLINDSFTFTLGFLLTYKNYSGH